MKTMSNKKEDVLRRVAEMEKLIKTVMDGEERRCEDCGNILYWVEYGAGKPPGVYCGNGCTEIRLNVGKV